MLWYNYLCENTMFTTNETQNYWERKMHEKREEEKGKSSAN